MLCRPLCLPRAKHDWFSKNVKLVENSGKIAKEKTNEIILTIVCPFCVHAWLFIWCKKNLIPSSFWRNNCPQGQIVWPNNRSMNGNYTNQFWRHTIGLRTQDKQIMKGKKWTILYGMMWMIDGGHTSYILTPLICSTLAISTVINSYLSQIATGYCNFHHTCCG